MRVAGLKRRIDAGVAVPSPAGIMPRDLHDAILTRTAELVADHSRVFNEDSVPPSRTRASDPDWAELTKTNSTACTSCSPKRIFP